MKKWLFALIAIGGFALIVVNTDRGERAPLNPPLPDSPNFVASTTFDGEWKGARKDTSGDSICLKTDILGSVIEGKVKIRLTYNNTILEGWISEQGDLQLYANSQRWGYRFAGTAQGDRIEGEWSVTNAPCKGTWYIDKLPSEA
ncbi:hypothetical protein [Thaumasiovibrio subtropicus]|uniref:hypothetical protein n=1 Tax=Thaumasiovibrio subtropicus TaxID=1891207 RepID=UPI000B34F5D3|nr:hypothetical protein [Thaumasiovibrio subtropicus]